MKSLDFKIKDKKTFVAQSQSAEYEIERSLLRDNDNSIVVCATILDIGNLSTGQKICNNIETFLKGNFFIDYKLCECYVANVFDENQNHLDTVIDNNFNKFARTFCKYLNQKHGTYYFTFFKYRALKKNDEGFIPLEKLEDLNSHDMLFQVTNSETYKTYLKKLHSSKTNHLTIN